MKKIAILSSFIFLEIFALSYPHNDNSPIKDWDVKCKSCHSPHNALGPYLGLVNGNYNMCYTLCHNPNGDAKNFVIEESKKAIPGTTGIHHAFNVPGDNQGYGASTSSAVYKNYYPGTGIDANKLICSTCHEQHNHNTGKPFLVASNPEMMCRDCHSQRVQSSRPFTTHPVGIPIPSSNPNYVIPQNLPLVYENQVGCMTCHDVHFVYSDTSVYGTATYGSKTSLTDNTKNWPTNMFVGWEIKIYPAGNDSANWFQIRTIISNTLNTVTWSNPLYGSGIVPGNRYVIRKKGSGNGYLLNQVMHKSPTSNLCGHCHRNFSITASHFTNTNAKWPGGEYGTDYAYVDALGNLVPPARRSSASIKAALPTSLRNSCFNCHFPHGWRDPATGFYYPKLLVDREEFLCFTCHDATGPSSKNVKLKFDRATRWVTAPVGPNNNLNLNDRHDIQDLAQSRSGAKIECTDCHDPHRDSGSMPLKRDPDPTDSRIPGTGQILPGGDFLTEWCLDCHDGSFPPTITPPTRSLVNIRNTYINSDVHGLIVGNPRLKAGYGWASNQIVPCVACHARKHMSFKNDLFQLKDTVFSRDGTRSIPDDDGHNGDRYDVLNNNTLDTEINGYDFCNTCHTRSMGSNRENCFASGCHHHGDDF
ncbi:MAG: cytochrome c3 family protein [Candidatus Hydrothermales bacterium]